VDKNCDNGFAQIEVQLNRRYDLVPNLLETVKGYMEHEQETLERVIAARNQAAQGLSNVGKSGKGGDGFASADRGTGAASGFELGWYPTVCRRPK